MMTAAPAQEDLTVEAQAEQEDLVAEADLIVEAQAAPAQEDLAVEAQAAQVRVHPI